MYKNTLAIACGLLMMILCACSNNSTQEELEDLDFDVEIVDSIQVEVEDGISAIDLIEELGNSHNLTQEEFEGLNFELEIIDSIQVDVLESISAIDFNKDRGVVYSLQNHQITVFDTKGKIIKSNTYPAEGPGAVGLVANLQILDNGEIFLYPFGNKLVLLDGNLEVKKYLEMPFPPELMGINFFQKNFAVHGDYAYLYYPGRDGGKPYIANFFKEQRLVEKLDLKSGVSENIYKLPEGSKYLSDLNYEFPKITLSAGNGKIYLALDTESFIYVYPMDSDSIALETLDFKPTKFVQMKGVKSEIANSNGRFFRGGVKNIYPIPKGVIVFYSEGIEEEVYQREALAERKNWSKRPRFDRYKLKVYLENQGWSNEIKVPAQIKAINGASEIKNGFWGLRNDDLVGEEQDYLTFYKMRLVAK